METHTVAPPRHPSPLQTAARSHAVPRYLLLLCFALFTLRLERRPLLHLGQFLGFFGLVVAIALLLGQRLSRTEKVLWTVLSLLILGVELKEARAFYLAEQTYLFCRITPGGAAVVQRVGKATLRDVTMRLIDHADLHALHENRADDIGLYRAAVQTVQLGNFANGSVKSLPLARVQDHNGLIRYHITFESDNGRWWEAVQLCRKDGYWLEALRVWRYNGSVPRLMYQSVDPGFPQLGDGSGWNWANEVL